MTTIIEIWPEDLDQAIAWMDDIINSGCATTGTYGDAMHVRNYLAQLLQTCKQANSATTD